MPSCQSIPGDESLTPTSFGSIESSAAQYINSVITAEISRATRAFVAGNLHIYVMPDNSADMIQLKPRDTTHLPLVDIWLQSVADDDVVSHSGTMKGVTGSLFIPDTDTAVPKSGMRAELAIRLAFGPAPNSDFETIYVDPDIVTMDGWAEGANERGPMSYWAGKVVLPPTIPDVELSTLAPSITPSG